MNEKAMDERDSLGLPLISFEHVLASWRTKEQEEFIRKSLFLFTCIVILPVPILVVVYDFFGFWETTIIFAVVFACNIIEVKRTMGIQVEVKVFSSALEISWPKGMKPRLIRFRDIESLDINEEDSLEISMKKGNSRYSKPYYRVTIHEDAESALNVYRGWKKGNMERYAGIDEKQK